MRCIFPTLTALLAVGAWALPAHSASGLNQTATVAIEVSCEDPQTGAIVEPKGSGFFVEESGYILTAFHVISCWDPQTSKLFNRKAIAVRIGSPSEPPRSAEPVRSDDQADIAILKLLGVPAKYPTLKPCSLRNPPAEMSFLAAGFPEGQGYQPVDGRIGNLDAAAGGWSAAADFARGMSGGPVAHNGFVVGLIKGGLKDVAAVRTIIPIYKAASIIELQTGKKLSDCRDAETESAESGVTPEDFSGTWRVRLGDDEGTLVIKQTSKGDRHFFGTLELNEGGTFSIDRNKGYWDGSAFVFNARNKDNVALDAKGRYCKRTTDLGSGIIVNGDMVRKKGGVGERLTFDRASYEEVCPLSEGSTAEWRTGATAPMLAPSCRRTRAPSAGCSTSLASRNLPQPVRTPLIHARVSRTWSNLVRRTNCRPRFGPHSIPVMRSCAAPASRPTLRRSRN